MTTSVTPATYLINRVIDKSTQRQIKRRLKDIELELHAMEPAGAMSDETIRTLNGEKVQIDAYLASTQGMHGRTRSFASDDRRAYNKILAAVRRTLEEIASTHPALHRHLEATLTVGVSSVYEPDPQITWRLTGAEA